MSIQGQKVKIRPAIEADRENIFDWLANSDLTPSLYGPPDFPELEIPTKDDFDSEYASSFFCEEGDGKGRNHVIVVDNEDVGFIGYDLLNKEKSSVVLDIWMSSQKYCGHGYGSDALSTLCNYLHERFGVSEFIISPSARNKRAVAAYKKAGFEYIKVLSEEEQVELFGMVECYDNVLMIKKVRD